MKKNKIRVTIKGPVRDLIRFVGHIGKRHRIFRKASTERPAEKHMLSLNRSLHPESQLMIIDKIWIESESTCTYRLVPKPHQEESVSIAPFRAGQYLSVEVQMDSGPSISRPYSISNTPEEARSNNCYEITVKSLSDAFIPGEMKQKWSIGNEVIVSDPLGQFCYESLRDPDHLLFIAGGSGITPYRSIVKDTLINQNEASIVLIQGAANSEELLYSDYFQKLEALFPGRFSWIPVLSDPSEDTDNSIHRGFINAEVLTEAAEDREYGIFICGPEALHLHINEELKKITHKPKRIRREDYGISGKPSGRKSVELTVKMSGNTYHISADPDETILVSLERAGLDPPSRCRTGSCGWCRGSLLKGKIRYDREPEGLRAADRSAGYFHSCAAKPDTNLTIAMPGKPGTAIDRNKAI